MSNGNVLVIPGYAGSELYTPPTFFGAGPRIWVWLDYALIAAGGWRLLGLQPDGVTPSTDLTGPLDPGFPLRAYYGTLSQILASLGWGVFSPKIDWRHVLSLDGEIVADYLRENRAYAPFHVIAHSRGGLVLRHALANLEATGELGLVGKVAGLGVPHSGAWPAIGVLAGWQRFTVLMRWLVLGVETLAVGPFTAADLQRAIVSWPSTYLLMPRPGAPGLPPPLWTKLYSSEWWSASGYTLYPNWLAAAPGLWATLPFTPQSVNWLDVCGIGLPTADQLLSDGVPSGSTDFTFTDQGDGTVTQAWGIQTARPLLTTPTAHNALVYDNRLISWLSDWFLGLNEGAGAIEGPILY